MKSIVAIVALIAFSGLAGAVVELSGTEDALALYSFFLDEDVNDTMQLGLFESVPGYANATEAKQAANVGSIGGFDYAELNEFNDLLSIPAIAPVGKVSNGPGRYKDGTSVFVQT